MKSKAKPKIKPLLISEAHSSHLAFAPECSPDNNDSRDSQSDISSLSSRHDSVDRDYEDYYPSPVEDFDDAGDEQFGSETGSNISHDEADIHDVNVDLDPPPRDATSEWSPSYWQSATQSSARAMTLILSGADSDVASNTVPARDESLAAGNPSEMLVDSHSCESGSSNAVASDTLSTFTIDAPPTRYGRIRKAREMEELSVCVCGH